MSFDVVYAERVAQEMYSWGLQLPVIDEVERKFEAELSEQPKQYLRDIGGTLQYWCKTSDSHIFLFRVRYSQSEEALIIWDCCLFPLRR